METVGLVAGVVSVILAVVAIWQAMYFYSKGKDTESRVETALVGIKAQVETLQAVNAKITERLTRYVTTPRNEAAQTAELFAVTLRSLPDIALKFLPPSQAASTNVWASFCLPHPEDFDPERHALAKRVVDQSAIDFKTISGLIAQLDQQEIQNRQFQFAHLYNEVTQHLRALVGDKSEHFARMSKRQT
jgi:hypothetical protein